jgi:Spy/CpxP family protein refolding chaperone
MKKLVLSAAMLAMGTFAMAQQSQKMQKMDPVKMEQKRADHMKQMQADLNLTDAQVTKLKALHDQKMKERKENAPQIQAERKAKMEQMKAKREQHSAEIKNILTPEQYQKWESARKEKMQGKKMMSTQKTK